MRVFLGIGHDSPKPILLSSIVLKVTIHTYNRITTSNLTRNHFSSWQDYLPDWEATSLLLVDIHKSTGMFGPQLGEAIPDTKAPIWRLGDPGILRGSIDFPRKNGPVSVNVSRVFWVRSLFGSDHLEICYIAIEHGHRNFVSFPVRHGGSFHSYVSHYQRVYPFIFQYHPLLNTIIQTLITTIKSPLNHYKSH